MTQQVCTREFWSPITGRTYTVGQLVSLAETNGSEQYFTDRHTPDGDKAEKAGTAGTR